jgi:hypothetical protein
VKVPEPRDRMAEGYCTEILEVLAPWQPLQAPLGANGMPVILPFDCSCTEAGKVMGVLVKKFPAALLVIVTPPTITVTASAGPPEAV